MSLLVSDRSLLVSDKSLLVSDKRSGQLQEEVEDG
jgi:hypothetical protein